MFTKPTRRTWINIGWIAAVIATVLNGLVVGYFAIWFQLFGDAADSADYLVSAGGYGTAAAVLALTVPAVLTHRAPRWLAWFAALSAVVLGLLSIDSVLTAGQVDQAPSGLDNAWDGIGGVVWAPWTWVLLWLGLRGLYRAGQSRWSVSRIPLSASSPSFLKAGPSSGATSFATPRKSKSAT